METRTTELVPEGFNLVEFINQALVTGRRRGFDPEIGLPSLRSLAKRAVHLPGTVTVTRVVTIEDMT